MRRPMTGILCGIIVWSAACGGSSAPAAPSTTSGTTSTTPTITSVSPASPTVSATSQTVTISGTNFAAGMTLSITAPAGSVTIVAAAQLQSVTSTSFQAAVTFAAAGTYSFQVTLATGDRSNAVTVATAAAAQTWTIEGAVLTEAAAGFPGQSIADVSAIRLQDGRWRVLFAGANYIRSAISTDGLSLTVESGIRIDPSSALGPLALAASVRMLRLDDGRIRAYFNSAGGLYSAISSDEAATFTIEPGVRLPASAIGDSSIQGGSVVRTPDGRWRMYFSGSQRQDILSASSIDLLSWTLDPGVRVGSGATLSGSGVHPCAILNTDGTISIFYFRSSPVGTWTATSTDGMTFSTETNIFAGPSPARADPDVVRLSDGSLRMYFNVGNSTSGTIYAARRSGSSVSAVVPAGFGNPWALPLVLQSPGGNGIPGISPPPPKAGGRAGGVIIK